jgi:hypothetical protein
MKRILPKNEDGTPRPWTIDLANEQNDPEAEQPKKKKIAGKKDGTGNTKTD